MNPTIPSQIDKMNAYFESSIDKLIKYNNIFIYSIEIFMINNY